MVVVVEEEEDVGLFPDVDVVGEVDDVVLPSGSGCSNSVVVVVG